MYISNYIRRLYYHYGDNVFVKKFTSIYSGLILKRIIKGTELIPIVYNEKHFVGQATHPDILLKDGMYYLTVSEYPFEIAHMENPYLFFSNDGKVFYPLAGGIVDAYTGNGKSHFSDGDILDTDNGIILYYRFCENDKNLKTDDIYIKIYDGYDWTERRLILSFQKDKCISPAVLFVEGHYEMFYAEMNAEWDSHDRWGSKLIRLESNTFLFDSFTKDIACINGMPEGRMLWHIDVVIDQTVYMGLFALSTDKGGVDCRLYYGYSKDKGKTWKIIAPIETGINNKYIKRIYRSSMVKVDGLWDIYISVCTPNDCWYVLLLEKQKLPISE